MYFLIIQIKNILIYLSDAGIWPYQKNKPKKKKKVIICMLTITSWWAEQLHLHQ